MGFMLSICSEAVPSLCTGINDQLARQASTVVLTTTIQLLFIGRVPPQLVWSDQWHAMSSVALAIGVCRFAATPVGNVLKANQKDSLILEVLLGFSLDSAFLWFGLGSARIGAT